jgi:hypothetical protein
MPARPILTLPARAALALASALPVALFVYTLRCHEFWRDEVQALLLGRDVPLAGLLHAMRLEGSPPLFHLILKVLSVALPAPATLALAGALGYAALLAGTFHLLRVLSRRPAPSLALTVALGLTNTFAYELGVLSRPYGLGLGLDLAGLGELYVALRLRRPRRALTGALLCGAAAITSDHAACVAGAALASFVLVALADRRTRSLVLPTLAALPFFALTWYLMAPCAERTAEVAVAANPHLDGVLRQAARVLRSGALAGGWWGPAGGAAPHPVIYALFAAALTLTGVVRLARSRHDMAVTLFPFGVALLSWATLLYIFVAWYIGSYRHHLFLWIPTLVYVLGWLARARLATGWSRWLLVAATVLLLPWLVLQYRVAWDDLAGDLGDDFSQTKRAAAILPAGAQVIADHDYAVLAMRAWRDDLTLRSPDGQGRALGPIIVDRRWHDRVPMGPLVTEACRAAADRTFVARRSMALPVLGPCLSPVQESDALLPSERFDLYRVSCPCVQHLR